VNLEVSFLDQLLRMHSLAMAHCPRSLTFSLTPYCLRQAKAHSRPSSPQSDKQRVVLRQVQSCAQVFSSYPQLWIKQRRTCLLSSFTCLRASTRAHQPSEQGSMYRQSFFFQCLPWCHLVASPGRTRSMMHAKAQSTMERMLEEVFRCILCRILSRKSFRRVRRRMPHHTRVVRHFTHLKCSHVSSRRVTRESQPRIAISEAEQPVKNEEKE
jgi:hypothetical protein